MPKSSQLAPPPACLILLRNDTSSSPPQHVFATSGWCEASLTTHLHYQEVIRDTLASLLGDIKCTEYNANAIQKGQKTSSNHSQREAQGGTVCEPRLMSLNQPKSSLDLGLSLCPSLVVTSYFEYVIHQISIPVTFSYNEWQACKFIVTPFKHQSSMLFPQITLKNKSIKF